MNVTRLVNVKVDMQEKYQKIDGFGVNINSKYWDNGGLIPVMELLVDDYGATIFRLDAYGNSNWIDPHSEYDRNILNQDTYDRVFNGIDFQNAAAMCKYLNSRGIEPYITLSGVVPRWMCEEDGKTLKDYEAFAEMAVAYLHWLKVKQGIRFTLFGPLNETDLGPPEGPVVSPEEFVKVLETLIDKLDEYKLDDIKLVVAEQSSFGVNYLDSIFKSSRLKGRIAVVGMHIYADYHVNDIVEYVENSEFKECRVWMTEYGDLDQSGEREWYVAWVTAQRLLRLLKDGMQGALNWDAYDNYHDHDEAWTIYGVIRSARKIYTPKKRYYACKQVYRYVRPGFVRIKASTDFDSVNVLAFSDANGDNFTIVGMNESNEDIHVNIDVENLKDSLCGSKADVYRTTCEEECFKIAALDINPNNWPYTGIQVMLPAKSIFTATTVK